MSRERKRRDGENVKFLGKGRYKIDGRTRRKKSEPRE